jgi:RNA polymerase sigma-70 factor (ECF subfamily)
LGLRPASVNPDAEPSDAELTAAAAQGDSRAFGHLVRRYMRPVLAVAWEYASTLDEAEDLAQDAFIRVLESLPRFDHERAFSPWLFTIVRNAGRNHALAQGRRTQVPLEGDLPADQVGADMAVERLAFLEEVGAAAGTLPPMQRACFRLVDLEGFSGGEVAGMLGIAPPTVRVHLHRARQALRPLLSPLILEDSR